jgi:hypothetical protein
MKNMLPDLQNHLFEMIEKLNDDDLKGEELDEEIKRALAINEVAKTAVANGALIAKCVDNFHGVPISDKIPLIPKPDGETFLVDNKRKTLTAVPRDDGNGGYKRNREQPI